MSSLEDKVNDKQSEGFVKKAAKIGYAGTMAGLTTMLSTAFVGTAGILIGGALAAGHTIGSTIKGGKTLYQKTFDALKTYSSANIFINPVLAAWDLVIPLIPGSGLSGFVARGLFASTAFNVYFNAVAKGAKHLVDNYLNPIGIINSIKHNFYNDWKRTAIGFSPGYTLAANGYHNLAALGLPPIIPTFAYNAFGLAMYNEIKPIPTKQASHSYTPKHFDPAAEVV